VYTFERKNVLIENLEARYCRLIENNINTDVGWLKLIYTCIDQYFNKRIKGKYRVVFGCKISFFLENCQMDNLALLPFQNSFIYSQTESTHSKFLSTEMIH